MLDAVLDRIMNELDDVEGGAAMHHSMEECPDPLSCDMHESENANPLAEHEGHPVVADIEVKKMGIPSLDSAEDSKAEDGLSPEEAEELKKLLGK